MKKGELFRWIGAALFVALGLLYIIPESVKLIFFITSLRKQTGVD